MSPQRSLSPRHSLSPRSNGSHRRSHSPQSRCSTPVVEIVNPTNADIHADVEELLGQEGTDPVINSFELNPTINKRWLAILADGLMDDNRKTILKKYDPPTNCGLLLAPKLNDEVAAAINDNALKRDKRIADQQNILSAAITAVGQVLNKLIVTEDSDSIERLSDSTRLLCDLFHTNTVTRRQLILPGLNKEVKETLEKTPISEYLFGDKLQETVNTCKAVRKSAQELKINTPKPPLPKPPHNLNYRGPPRTQPPRQSGPKPTPRRTVKKPPTNRPRQQNRRHNYQHHRRR